ncbi:TetR/AcrR family transcriptional regulator [Pelagibius litoralis]|uniref:TetR/AcrR family transcriptional regulator n=1 Tax=Pelagibius litoralis TaxID=374515 RepID=A0A967EV59_9PROT|nr:TetR/AcrR family transcriptional regulator [Pelagibius litoralis]NIA68027.1 TetR/AcrR family transcriptional regulator [Pelagibius litoralis]
MSAITADKVLDIAQRLVQTRGYNGFSYRDIAEEIGIKSASIHYHFPSKADLGVALVSRYREAFAEELQDILTRNAEAPKRLKCFVALFRATLRDDRLCLCGMLGAEMGGLPAPVNNEVSGFFILCEAWLIDVLKQGRKAEEIAFRGNPQAVADQFLSLLEGAMVVARAMNDTDRFDRAANAFLRVLRTPDQD